MYVFKDEFKTGIERIDVEHAKLFEIADRAYMTLTDEFITDKYDYIVDILNELKDYAANHFKHEEAYMMSINYKKLISHKVLHDEFIEKVSGISLDAFDDDHKEVIFEILDFLNNWLVEHILKNDKLISQ